MQYAHLAQPTCLHNNLNVQRSFLSHNFNVVQAGRLQRTFRTLVHKGLQRPAIQTSLERALLHSTLENWPYPFGKKSEGIAERETWQFLLGWRCGWWWET